MGINWGKENNVQVENSPNINLGFIVDLILCQIFGISQQNMKIHRHALLFEEQIFEKSWNGHKLGQGEKCII